jgi:hypothetical protein
MSKELNGKLYTSQNLWFEHPERFYNVNYKTGTFIPAGSEVHDIKVNRKAIYFLE